MTDEKVLENRLRRVADRRGLILQKSRRRDTRALDYGGYMLVDASTNSVVFGAAVNAFDATLSDIEAYLEDGPSAKKPAKAKK